MSKMGMGKRAASSLSGSDMYMLLISSGGVRLSGTKGGIWCCTSDGSRLSTVVGLIYEPYRVPCLQDKGQAVPV